MIVIYYYYYSLIYIYIIFFNIKLHIIEKNVILIIKKNNLYFKNI